MKRNGRIELTRCGGAMDESHMQFLESLLNGERLAIDPVELGLHGSYQLLSLRFPRDIAHDAAAFLPQLGPQLHPHFYAVLEQDLIVLCSLRHTQAIPAQVLDALQQVGLRCGATIGISQRTVQFEELPLLLWQARHAATVGACILHQPVTYFRDVPQFALFHAANTQEDLHQFVLPEILRLQQIDSQTNGHDLDLLYWYLHFEQNATLTAEKLFVHRHTLMRHLSRITASLSGSLQDGNYVFLLQLSFYILQYLQLFTPELSA